MAEADAGTWAALRRSALDIAPSMAEWETLCKEATGKADPQQMIEADKAKVSTEIARRQRDHKAAVAAAERVPADALEHVPATAGSH